LCVELETRQILIFVRVAAARGIGERAERSDAGQICAGVVAAAPVVMLKQIAVGRNAGWIEKSERRERLVRVRFLVVVEAAVGSQPVEQAVAGSSGAGEAGPVGYVFYVGQSIERVRRVRDSVGDLRAVR